MLHEFAGIKDEIKVIRTGESTFFILCTGAVEASWIKKHVPASSAVVIQDVTAGTCSVGVIGAKASEILESFDSTIFNKSKWKTGQAKQVYIKNVPVLAVYDSFAGMDNWEFFATFDQGLQLWDVLFEAGSNYQIAAVGDRALENLRIESLALRAGKDFWSEHDPFEINLGQLVDLTKPDFIGKQALLERMNRGPQLLLTMLELEDPSKIVMGYEPVLVNGKVEGFVTSAGYSYTRGKGIAYALLSPQAVKNSGILSIEYFGEQYSAKVISNSAKELL